jgi:hypothetical protein
LLQILVMLSLTLPTKVKDGLGASAQMEGGGESTFKLAFM